MRPTPTLLTLLAAGALATPALLASEERAPELSTRHLKGLPFAHIYLNLSTGERVITPLDWRSRSDSNAAWLNNNTDPCATGGTVGLIDDPDLDGDGLGDTFGGDCATGTFPCEGSWSLWWGDIEPDSVVDCIVTYYGVTVLDNDIDADSIGEGVVGFDMYLTFSDSDNGYAADGASGRSCIIDLVIPSLPGDVCVLPWGFVPVYILTVDLADSAPSLIFELGDSDGIDNAGTGLSGAAIYGAPTARDLDADGLHDFSYAMRFDQSTLGTSGIRGETKGIAGFVSSAPKLGNPGDRPPTIADAMGLEDAMDIYRSGPSCPPDTSSYIGTFNFGDFSCPPVARPYASAVLELYSPNADSLCDANLDGSPLPANFADVILFLTDFTGPCTDAIGNFDHTGACDFADVIAFLTSFASPECGN